MAGRTRPSLTAVHRERAGASHGAQATVPKGVGTAAVSRTDGELDRAVATVRMDILTNMAAGSVRAGANTAKCTRRDA